MVTQVCANPTIDFNGGMIITLHATRLRCRDETDHEGVWPFEGEWIANDAMRLGGVVTTQHGPQADPVQCRLKPQDLGSDYEDNRSFDFDKELYRTFVAHNALLPVASHALLLLVEEDWGGLNWDSSVKETIDAVGAALRTQVTSAVGAAVGAGIGTSLGPLGTLIGTGVGALAGLIAGEIAAAVKKTESDVFPAQETSFIIGMQGVNTKISETKYFTDHGGDYELALEWRVRTLPGGLEKVALQAHNGKYVVAEGGGGMPLLANRDRPLEWETFGLTRLTGDRVAFLASNGDFVAAEGGGGRELIANRPWAREWESFQMEHVGDNLVAFRSHNGQYISAEGGGGRELVANRAQRGTWETFRLHRV